MFCKIARCFRSRLFIIHLYPVNFLAVSFTNTYFSAEVGSSRETNNRRYPEGKQSVAKNHHHTDGIRYFKTIIQRHHTALDYATPSGKQKSHLSQEQGQAVTGKQDTWRNIVPGRDEQKIQCQHIESDIGCGAERRMQPPAISHGVKGEDKTVDAIRCFFRIERFPAQPGPS